MKEKCMICGSTVEDVSGVCPVCGAALARSTQADSTEQPETTPNGTPNGVQSGNPYGVQPGNPYGTPDEVPNGVQSGIYPDANYQNPNGMNTNAPKKKVFAILSLVCSIVSLLTCCVPGLGMVLGIAAVVFGIIALIKKQVKVPAIIGLVIGGIALLLSFSYLCMNLMFSSIAGTDINGMMEQLMEVEMEGGTTLENIVFQNPGDTEFYALYSDGSYETSSYNYGTYHCYSYMDYYAQTSTTDSVTYAVIYAMSEGYEIKNAVILDFGSDIYVFIVPDDFEAGDDIYYVDCNGNFTSMDSYQLLSVPTMDIDDIE
jgi:hypothetical protein